MVNLTTERGEMKNTPFEAARRNVRWDIRRELDERGLTMADVGRMAKVSRQTVSDTVKGHKHSPAVLDVLRKIGVPEKYIHDPRRGMSVTENRDTKINQKLTQKVVA